MIAFVGSFSLDDQDGGVILAKHPTSERLVHCPRTLDLPNTVSPDPAIGGWQLGPLEYFAQHYPVAIKHVGLLIAQESSLSSRHLGFEAAMSTSRLQDRLLDPFRSPRHQFETQLLAMQHAGVQSST